jgi:hypothetical protein
MLSLVVSVDASVRGRDETDSWFDLIAVKNRGM